MSVQVICKSLLNLCYVARLSQLRLECETCVSSQGRSRALPLELLGAQSSGHPGACGSKAGPPEAPRIRKIVVLDRGLALCMFILLGYL